MMELKATHTDRNRLSLIMCNEKRSIKEMCDWGKQKQIHNFQTSQMTNKSQKETEVILHIQTEKNKSKVT